MSSLCAVCRVYECGGVRDIFKRKEKKTRRKGDTVIPLTKKSGPLFKEKNASLSRDRRYSRARDLFVRLQLFKICTILIKHRPPSSFLFFSFFLDFF